MKEVTEVIGMGWLGFIQDPTGAILGLWQYKPKRVLRAESVLLCLSVANSNCINRDLVGESLTSIAI